MQDKDTGLGVVDGFGAEQGNETCSLVCFQNEERRNGLVLFKARYHFIGWVGQKVWSGSNG